MKKRMGALLAALLMLLAAVPALAAENSISSLCVWVSLNGDGSADIEEEWKIRSVYDGTEYYKALNNVGESAVSDLRVTDDRGMEYETLNGWDVDASFDEKANRCGIRPTDNGSYELCWGISEMGDRTYTISYHLENLVKHYEDADGFYYRFVSDGMSSAPEYAQVAVWMADGTAMTEENCEAWAFGYDGEVHFRDGEIDAWTTGSMGDSDYINLLVRFQPGWFSAPLTAGTFADVQDRALNADKYEMIEAMTVLGIVAVLALIVGVIVYRKRTHIVLADGTNLRRVRQRDIENREHPPCESIEENHALLRLGREVPNSPVSAYLIRWGLNQNATLERNPKDEDDAVLTLRCPPEGTPPEADLYEMFREVSFRGSLPLDAWQDWLEDHSYAMDRWKESMEDFGQRALIAHGWAQEDAKGKLRLTREGYDRYVELLGYRKTLQEIGRSGAPSVSDSQWRQLLVYAAYFELAKDVVPCFDRVPQEIWAEDPYYMDSSYYLFAAGCGRHYAEPPASESSGGGGSAFSSGGGGFSGGGGGGSR